MHEMKPIKSQKTLKEDAEHINTMSRTDLFACCWNCRNVLVVKQVSMTHHIRLPTTTLKVLSL